MHWGKFKRSIAYRIGMPFLLIILAASLSTVTLGGGGGGGGGDAGCSGNNGQACGYCGTYNCGGSCTGQGSCGSGQVEYGGSCGNCGTLSRTCSGSCSWGSWECINQGSCSPNSTQCSGTRYQNCTSGCQWQNAGTDADSDGTDYQCGDSLCDNVAGIYNATKTSSETPCTDGLDNDCDGTADCADADCAGGIAGTVENGDNATVQGATVSALTGTTAQAEATTNSSGQYAMAVNCGTYNLVVSREEYAPLTKENVVVPPQSQATSNFTSSSNYSLMALGSCEADCTTAGSDLIGASCGGVNGCGFYDSTAAQACNLARIGWFRNYGETQEVECPSGIPREKSSLTATATCGAGSLAKSSTIVLYKGKPVKLVVASCG